MIRQATFRGSTSSSISQSVQTGLPAAVNQIGGRRRTGKVIAASVKSAGS